MVTNKNIGYLHYSIGKRAANPSDKNSEKKYYVIAQARETLDVEKLSQHMAEHGSPFTEGTIKGVLTDFLAHAVEFLRQGYSIRLDGLLDLRYSFSSEGVDDPDEAIPANTVKKVNLNAFIAPEAEAKMNTNVDFQYEMTRAAQAAAKKAAKEKLKADGKDNDNTSAGSGSGSGNGGIEPGGDVTE